MRWRAGKWKVEHPQWLTIWFIIIKTVILITYWSYRTCYTEFMKLTFKHSVIPYLVPCAALVVLSSVGAKFKYTWICHIGIHFEIWRVVKFSVLTAVTNLEDILSGQKFRYINLGFITLCSGTEMPFQNQRCSRSIRKPDEITNTPSKKIITIWTPHFVPTCIIAGTIVMTSNDLEIEVKRRGTKQTTSTLVYSNFQPWLRVLYPGGAPIESW
jgi:hypothetical protein